MSLTFISGMPLYIGNHLYRGYRGGGFPSSEFRSVLGKRYHILFPCECFDALGTLCLFGDFWAMNSLLLHMNAVTGHHHHGNDVGPWDVIFIGERASGISLWLNNLCSFLFLFVERGNCREE
jgi:hypothetical protein